MPETPPPTPEWSAHAKPLGGRVRVVLWIVAGFFLLMGIFGLVLEVTVPKESAWQSGLLLWWVAVPCLVIAGVLMWALRRSTRVRD